MEGVKEMKTTSKLWRPARKNATSASYLRNLDSAWDTSPAIIMIQKPESAKISSMVYALVMKTTSKPWKLARKNAFSFPFSEEN